MPAVSKIAAGIFSNNSSYVIITYSNKYYEIEFRRGL